jgi:hypothetical protein
MAYTFHCKSGCPAWSCVQINVEARAGGHGVYQAAAPLSMFGSWRLAVRVAAPHRAPVSHVFALNMDIPASVLKALAVAGQ